LSKKNDYTITSLFSGVGGLDLGFKFEGFKILWANDNRLNAVKTYNYNIGSHAECKDIRTLLTDDIPSADIIIGGPPCQSFSHLGVRNQNDPRGRLVFKFLEIIKEKQPRIFVMENVPGIESSRIDGNKLVDYLTNEYKKMGYSVSKFKLLATNYLVPQKRKRVFLIGGLGLTIQEPDPITFAKTCYDMNLQDYDLSAKAAIDDLGECVKNRQRAHYNKEPHSMFSKIMRKKRLTDVSLHICPRMSQRDKLFIKYIPPGGNYRNIPDEIATERIKKFKKTGGRTTTYGRLHPEHPAYTINTYFRRPNVGCNFHYEKPRLITPREAMRFQSMPDDFEIFYNSQDERNAYIGNAVPPLLSHALAWSIKMSLQNKPMPKLQSHLTFFREPKRLN